MNTSSSLVVTLLLMSFLTEVLPSNPDSEIFQDNSSSDGQNQEKSAPMKLDKQPRSALTDPKIFRGMTVVKKQPVAFVVISGVPDIIYTANEPRVGSIDSNRNNNHPDFSVPNDDKTIPSNNANIIPIMRSGGSNAPFPQESFQKREDEPSPPESPQRQPNDLLPEESPQMPPNEPFARNSPHGAITSEPPNEFFSPESLVGAPYFRLSRESPQKRPIVPSSRKVPQNVPYSTQIQHMAPNYAERYNGRNPYISESGNNSPYNPTNNAPPLARSPYPSTGGNRNNQYISYGQFGRPYMGGRQRPNGRPPSSGSEPSRKGNPSSPCPTQYARCRLGDSSRNGDEPRVVTGIPNTERIPQIVPVNPATNRDRRVPPDSNLYAEMVNDFAFKMMETLNPDGNFVISPLSIFIALSMCYLGSEGSTKSQLESVLGLKANAALDEQFHKGLKDLESSITLQSTTSQIVLANGLFLGSNYSVIPEFKEGIQRYYTAELKKLDFGNQSTSIPAINDWVTRKTGGMITSMADIPPDSSTRLLLLNAMYFKGIWRTQFSEDLTFNGRFFNLEGIERTVPTMVLYNETFPFYRSEEHGHSFLKLPYQDADISMILALPHAFEEKPMPNIRQKLMCHIRDSMKDTQMDTVSIPRFRQSQFRSLERPLIELGIRDLFDPKKVNLTKMRIQNDLVVSAIMHKAVIEVNEEGTTASAITGVRLVPLSYRNTTNFLVNHPFAFYLVHEPTGLVLFYGKIVDTVESSGANSNRKQVGRRRG